MSVHDEGFQRKGADGRAEDRPVVVVGDSSLGDGAGFYAGPPEGQPDRAEVVFYNPWPPVSNGMRGGGVVVGDLGVGKSLSVVGNDGGPEQEEGR